MSDPHREERFGEVWPQHRIDAYLTDLKILKPFITLSGGWAWHFLSPVGHTEYKHAHDHKDVDLHIPGYAVGSVMGILESLGYGKVPTIYDDPNHPQRFRRYERTVSVDNFPPFKLTIDFFVMDYPTLETPEGWRVVSPDTLLTFYGDIHSSDKCWAVLAAKKLLSNGETPQGLIGRSELTYCPDLDVYQCTKCGWVGQFLKKEMKGLTCGGCEKGLVRSLGKPTYQAKGKV